VIYSFHTISINLENSMPGIVKFDAAKVGAFLGGLNIGPHDEVKMSIRAGVVTAHVKRGSGQAQSATTMLGGQFQRRTAADLSGSPRDRRKIVRQLTKEGLRQTAIADLLGVSQATVSLDLKKIARFALERKRLAISSAK
jgi:DNA-binding CsgD family transcriptional regulator